MDKVDLLVGLGWIAIVVLGAEICRLTSKKGE